MFGGRSGRASPRGGTRKTRPPLWALAAAFVAAGTSVPAAALFTLSLDVSTIAFGALDVGSTTELPGVSGYHHTLTVNSDQAPWYVKIHNGGPLSSGGEQIANANFHWIVDSTDGTGTIANPGTYAAFTTGAVPAYTASAGDAGGQDIHVRFRYKLSVPVDQAAGTYTATVTFTLTQVL